MKNQDQKSLESLYQHIVESSNSDHSILKLTFTNLIPKDKELLISYVEALDDPNLDEIKILSDDSLEYFQYNVSYVGIKKEIKSKKPVPFYVTQMYSMMKHLLSKNERILTAAFDRIFKNCDVKLYKNKDEMNMEKLTKKLPELRKIF